MIIRGKGTLSFTNREEILAMRKTEGICVSRNFKEKEIGSIAFLRLGLFGGERRKSYKNGSTCN